MRRWFWFGVVVILCGGGCSGVTPREHYIEALQLRMRGNNHGYFDKLLYLAAEHSDTRPGRRARSILMSTDLGLTFGSALWGATHSNRAGTKWGSTRNDSDVREILEKVFLRQVAFKQNRGRYCERFEDCDVKISPSSGYVYFMGSKAVAGGGGRSDPHGLRLDAIAVMSALGVVPIATSEGFLATAIGNVDRDGDLDVWLVDHSGLLVQLLKD